MTMKTMILASFAALSLGASAAMAQEGGNTYPATPDYWAPDSIGQRQAQAVGADRIQAGSSDVEPMHSGVPETPMNWQNLPSYGGQG